MKIIIIKILIAIVFCYVPFIEVLIKRNVKSMK